MAADMKDKIWCCAKFGEVLFIGEKLRRQIYNENPSLIKDRWYYSLSRYHQCFVGKELVDWLVSSGQVPNRAMAVAVITILMNNEIIHQVNRSTNEFKDDGTLYRFNEDDNDYKWIEDLDIYIKGKLLYQTLRVRKVLRTCTENDKTYKFCCPASEIIDHMLDTRAAVTRDEAVEQGRRLIINEILAHVENKFNFEDSNNLFHFVANYSRSLSLLDLVIPPPESESEGMGEGPYSDEKLDGSQEFSAVSPRLRHKLISKEMLCNRKPVRSESGYHSDLHDSPSTPPTTELYVTSSPNSDVYLGPCVPHVRKNKPSVEELSTITYDDLFGENSMYVRKTLSIEQDDVGFGFVVRGDGPVYVKTLDPESPAARSGLKVGHFIYSINSTICVNMDHREVAEIVVSSDGIMRMVIMEFGEDLFV